MKLLQELIEELKMVLGGSTVDAILPTLVFLVSIRWFGLIFALTLALIVSSLSVGIRKFRQQSSKYAFLGIVGVLVACLGAYINRNAQSYFIPDFLGNVFIFVISLISLAARKPLAAWVSHLSRGWPLEWYWRQDVMPAYTNVTTGWAAFFLIRVVLQFILFRQGSFEALAIYSILMGLPLTILVLLVTYIYGIWKLHKLGGPGSDEYMRNQSPPWKGQRRGF